MPVYKTPSGTIKIIYEVGRTEAVLIAHGEYRPSVPVGNFGGFSSEIDSIASLWVRFEDFTKRSGEITVPAGMTIYFYAKPGEFGIGSPSRVANALRNQLQHFEKVTQLHKVPNYSLTHKDRDVKATRDDGTPLYEYANPDWLAKQATRDLILIRQGKEATLADVLKAMTKVPGKNYTALHALHCRVTHATAKKF